MVAYFMFVMEVGITLMELCYNLTTIALPRPTNDDSIRSFFLLLADRVPSNHSGKAIILHLHTCAFFYSSLPAAEPTKKRVRIICSLVVKSFCHLVS